MDDPADDAPRLVAAPRHLRRRPFHAEIPDTLLVPGVEPIRSEHRSADSAKRAAALEPDDEVLAYRRKRLIALIAVILVALSVPALVIALIFLG